MRLLFQHGKFTAHSTTNVCFAVDVPRPRPRRVFLQQYSRPRLLCVKDIKTPMRISIFCLAINLIFTALFLFRFKLGSGSLGLANTSVRPLTSPCWALSWQETENSGTYRILPRNPRVFAAAAVAALVAWYSARFLDWPLWPHHAGNEIGRSIRPNVIGRSGLFRHRIPPARPFCPRHHQFRSPALRRYTFDK